MDKKHPIIQKAKPKSATLGIARVNGKVWKAFSSDATTFFCVCPASSWFRKKKGLRMPLHGGGESKISLLVIRYPGKQVVATAAEGRRDICGLVNEFATTKTTKTTLHPAIHRSGGLSNTVLVATRKSSRLAFARGVWGTSQGADRAYHVRPSLRCRRASTSHPRTPCPGGGGVLICSFP